jgi:hypothetical protein
MEFPDIKGLLLHPKSTFEEIVEDTTWKKGLGAWFLFTFIGTSMFLLFSAAVGSRYIVMDFGLGTGFVTTLGLFKAVGIFFILFLVTATLCHLGAKVFKGTGTLGGTIGVLGYANIPTAIKGILSGFFTLIHYLMIQQGIKGLLLYDGVNTQMFSNLVTASVIVSIIFSIWITVLYSIAISVAHQIKIWKSFVIVIIANAIIFGILFGVYYIRPL